MQRCPYIFEMKERLLGSQRNTESVAMESFSERDNLLEHTSRPASNQVGAKVVGTVVKVRVSSFETPELVQVAQVIFLLFLILFYHFTIKKKCNPFYFSLKYQCRSNVIN